MSARPLRPRASTRPPSRRTSSSCTADRRTAPTRQPVATREAGRAAGRARRCKLGSAPPARASSTTASLSTIRCRPRDASGRGARPSLPSAYPRAPAGCPSPPPSCPRDARAAPLSPRSMGGTNHLNLGAFCRLDVPRIVRDRDLAAEMASRGLSADTVLYTDTDVLFADDFEKVRQPPRTFSAGTEVFSPSMNSGVMVMNVSAFIDEWPAMISYAIDRKFRCRERAEIMPRYTRVALGPRPTRHFVGSSRWTSLGFRSGSTSGRRENGRRTPAGRCLTKLGTTRAPLSTRGAGALVGAQWCRRTYGTSMGTSQRTWYAGWTRYTPAHGRSARGTRSARAAGRADAGGSRSAARDAATLAVSSRRDAFCAHTRTCSSSLGG